MISLMHLSFFICTRKLIILVLMLDRINKFSYEKHLKWYLEYKKPSLSVSYYYLSNRNNVTCFYLTEMFEHPIISIFIIDAMWDNINHIKYNAKVKNFITSITGNNVDVCPPLISMAMFIEKVSNRIINSTISLEIHHNHRHGESGGR